MINLNKTAQKAQDFKRSYKWAYLKGQFSLWNVYTSYSKAKYDAFNYCIEKMMSYNGYGGVITGYNSCVFTFGFKYEDHQGQEHLYIICKCNEYDITL